MGNLEELLLGVEELSSAIPHVTSEPHFPYFDTESLMLYGLPWCFQTVKNLPAMQETWAQSLGWEDPLEEEMATHSSILAWEVPGTEEPDRLQSVGSQTRTWLSYWAGQYPWSAYYNATVGITPPSSQAIWPPKVHTREGKKTMLMKPVVMQKKVSFSCKPWNLTASGKKGSR